MFPEQPTKIRERITSTGVGLAGIDGVWWLPAARPFTLPAKLAENLAEFGRAIFSLLDVVTAMYGTPAGDECGLNWLLEHKVPLEIPRLVAPGRALMVRPDFQLRPVDSSPGYELVATELEICPSAQGFAHAMQAGYGLTTDLVAAFAHLLRGRELLFVCTSQWSEFLFEQLAFCRALAEAGARARVLYDEPIAAIAARVRAGASWRPPMFGMRARPAIWHDDVAERVRAHGFESFLWPDAAGWPDSVGDAVIFRFGYFDCFAPERLKRMLGWQAAGASFLNPTSYILDSKAVMAALGIPAVREAIGARAPEALAALARCIPETLLLEPAVIERLLSERADWVVKYAGYDHDNQAWGGRSLQIGAQRSPEEWASILDAYLDLPWPVVAQRAVPTARVDIEYLDGNGAREWMCAGATRLRSFMLREDAPGAIGAGPVTVAGSHLTVAASTTNVSESTDAVQAPIVFVG